MSKPHVKRRPMSSGVINPQTTVLKSITSDQFHNYGILLAFGLPAVVSLVYCVLFGIHAYTFMSAAPTGDIRLIDEWLWHETVKSANTYILYVYCLPSIAFMCMQVYRWSRFFIQGATFAYDRDNLWSTQTYWKSVWSISLTYALVMVFCGFIFAVVGMALTSAVVFLLINVFVIWWVNALFLIVVLGFSVMCYIRSRTRLKLEVKLMLENEDYANR